MQAILAALPELEPFRNDAIAASVRRARRNVAIDEETIAEYASAALEDPNPDAFLAAVRDVALARGMAQLARDAGLGRENLYDALTPGTKPRIDTMLKQLCALGAKLSASLVRARVCRAPSKGPRSSNILFQSHVKIGEPNPVPLFLPSVLHTAKECTMYRKLTPPLLSFLIVACAGLQRPTAEVFIPDKLKVQSNESLGIIVRARGVQIYECRARQDQAGRYVWAFLAPEADLFDERGNRLGRHYAGPSWQSTDGSTIVGSVKERADAPLVDAIPWLLLSVTSAGPEGFFSKITSIQRVNTVGGIAPKEGCSQAAVGTTARIKYRADYYFYITK